MTEHDEFYPALAEITDRLEREEATYVLVGGLAVGLWLRAIDEAHDARYRSTVDIDLGVSAATVQSLGASKLKGESLVYRLQIRGKPVDVLRIEASTGEGLEGSDVLVDTYNDFSRLQIPGQKANVRVLHQAPLVLMKAVAYANNPSRTKDLVDVAFLAVADMRTGALRTEFEALRRRLPRFEEHLKRLALRFDSEDAIGPGEYSKAMSTKRFLGEYDDEEQEHRQRAHHAVMELFER